MLFRSSFKSKTMMISPRSEKQDVITQYLSRRYRKSLRELYLRAALLSFTKLVAVGLLWAFFVIPNIPAIAEMARYLFPPLLVVVYYSELSGIYSEVGEE